MTSIASIMKKAASAQRDMEKARQELASRTVEFSSGGGMVKVTASCDGSVKSVKIDPRAIDPAEAELLGDMVLAAVEGALKEGREIAAREMSRLAAGFGLPGLSGMG